MEICFTLPSSSLWSGNREFEWLWNQDVAASFGSIQGDSTCKSRRRLFIFCPYISMHSLINFLGTLAHMCRFQSEKVMSNRFLQRLRITGTNENGFSSSWLIQILKQSLPRRNTNIITNFFCVEFFYGSFNNGFK